MIWPLVGFKKWHKDARGDKQAEAHDSENCSSDVGRDERGTGREGSSAVHGFFSISPVPSCQEGLHLSLYSLSSGEGKIENFENPSFSKFWYRSRSLCPKGRAMRFYEMAINLEVFNLETDFFGDLHSSSRFTDMLCDAQAQYGDYSELGKCPMWGMWKKEGGDKGPTESRRERGLKK